MKDLYLSSQLIQTLLNKALFVSKVTSSKRFGLFFQELNLRSRFMKIIWAVLFMTIKIHTYTPDFNLASSFQVRKAADTIFLLILIPGFPITPKET